MNASRIFSFLAAATFVLVAAEKNRSLAGA